MQWSLVPRTAWVRLNPHHRGATRTGMPLIAVAVTDITEIAASRALQNIAAERCHVSQLRTSGELERVGDQRIAVLDLWMRSDVGHARQRAQTQIAIIEINCRPLLRQRIDVNQKAWTHHIELHQIDQRGAASKKLNRIVA
jgi:hypothetical protein